MTTEPNTNLESFEEPEKSELAPWEVLSNHAITRPGFEALETWIDDSLLATEERMPSFQTKNSMRRSLRR
jgi:hypothetical protein